MLDMSFIVFNNNLFWKEQLQHVQPPRRSHGNMLVWLMLSSSLCWGKMAKLKYFKAAGASRCAIQALFLKLKETGNSDDRRHNGLSRNLQ